MTEEERKRYYVAQCDQALKMFLHNGQNYAKQMRIRNEEAKHRLVMPDGQQPPITKKDLINALSDLFFTLDFLTYVAINVELILNDQAPSTVPNQQQMAIELLSVVAPVCRNGVPQGLSVLQNIQISLMKAGMAKAAPESKQAAPEGQPAEQPAKKIIT